MSNVIEIARGEAECYFNCFTFPRIKLHACTLTRTISLSYCGISLRATMLFHLVSMLFHLYILFHFPHAISIERAIFPIRF